jgi:hypothetical protein
MLHAINWVAFGSDIRCPKDVWAIPIYQERLINEGFEHRILPPGEDGLIVVESAFTDPCAWISRNRDTVRGWRRSDGGRPLVGFAAVTRPAIREYLVSENLCV